MIREDRVGALRRVTLSSAALEVAVLPELGGKLVRLARPGPVAQSGHDRREDNVLLEPPEAERPWRPATHGARFEDFDVSGLDDCFPTVAACPAPDEPALRLPDHGDLWSVPWQLDAAGDSLTLSARARSLPCRLTRRVSLDGNRVRLDYTLASEADRPLAYLWSAHPLLAVSPGSRIHLPAEVSALLLEWSAGDRLGHRGDRVPWPRAGVRDLSLLPGPEAGVADKLFTDRLRHGLCAVHDVARARSLTFRFDPARLPYLGLWICAGGWPTSRAAKHFTLALEPCSGRPDSLAEAVRAGTCARLAARETATWSLELELTDGPPPALP